MSARTSVHTGPHPWETPATYFSRLAREVESWLADSLERSERILERAQSFGLEPGESITIPIERD